jgi:hypothetical protein
MFLYFDRCQILISAMQMTAVFNALPSAIMKYVLPSTAIWLDYIFWMK